MQGIGVDADQAYLGDQIMTSALKKVDVAVQNVIKQTQDGQFKGGTDVINDIKSGGIGFGKTNSVGAKYESQVQDDRVEDLLRRDRGHPQHGEVIEGRTSPPWAGPGSPA